MKARTEKQHRNLAEHAGLSLSPGNTRGFIEMFSYEIENYGSEEAKASMDRYVNAQGFEAFLLGGILNCIKCSHWYQEYGYSSFEDMVENRLGISIFTAHDYMELYDALKGEYIPWKKIKHLGWTKLKWYGKNVTEHNVDEWLRAVDDAGDNFESDFAVPGPMKQEMAEGEMLP
jgi:hypothetical protein